MIEMYATSGAMLTDSKTSHAALTPEKMADQYAAALALLKQLTELHATNTFSNAQELLVPLKVRTPAIVFRRSTAGKQHVVTST